MTPEIRQNLFEIATENAEELYDEHHSGGFWVENDSLPSHPNEFSQSELEEVFSAQRLEEDGEAVTEAELKALREARVASISCGDCDADGIPAYCLAEIADAEGNTGVAFILCSGHSFSGLKHLGRRDF
jgi:hypothetical protein